MGKTFYTGRVLEYYRRNGFLQTLKRLWVFLHRVILQNQVVLFSCELINWLPTVDCPGELTFERKEKETDLETVDLEKILAYWNKAVKKVQIRERFEKGATLWLVRSADELAGFRWTIAGMPVKPHFFPLSERDVHLFDGHVFSEFRGRGINPAFIDHILRTLGEEGYHRAFVETHAWNSEQLNSLRKTGFRRIGMARRFKLFGYALVIWSIMENEKRSQIGVSQQFPDTASACGFARDNVKAREGTIP